MTEVARRVPVSVARRADKGARARNIRNWLVIAGATFLMALVVWPLAVAYGGFIVVMGAVLAFRFKRQARRLVADINAGVKALSVGDLKSAHDLFWRSAEISRLPSLSAVARHNLGWTLMRQGELEQAIAVLLDNDERNGQALKAGGFAATCSIDLALDYALIGDLACADRWTSEAEKRVDELTTPTFEAMKVFSSSVIACSRGQHEEAVRILDDHWPTCEGTLMGEALRPLRVIRAFAVASTGPRNAGMADALLALSRPTYAGEYDFLGKAWPEMEMFLTTIPTPHGGT
jgi:hypothetical protein